MTIKRRLGRRRIRRGRGKIVEKKRKKRRTKSDDDKDKE